MRLKQYLKFVPSFPFTNLVCLHVSRQFIACWASYSGYWSAWIFCRTKRTSPFSSCEFGVRTARQLDRWHESHCWLGRGAEGFCEKDIWPLWRPNQFSPGSLIRARAQARLEMLWLHVYEWLNWVNAVLPIESRTIDSHSFERRWMTRASLFASTISTIGSIISSLFVFYLAVIDANARG